MTDISQHRMFMMRAVELSLEGSDKNMGGPFGCVIVKGGKIIAEGYNKVLHTNDPTAHAEIVAIRNACAVLNHFQLTDCDVYSSCEPCPMCLSALYWARPKAVFYSNTKAEAALIGFDDESIYQEIQKTNSYRHLSITQVRVPESFRAFEKWKASGDKKLY